uniref:Synaptophysin like 1 n=1 Tax=Strix occidentalis caurina TaxID=311401 RepID=A0A8D0L0D5_STROC
YRLNTVVFSAPDPKHCGGTWTDIYLVGNFSSSAQFFVTLAVLVFLYCIAALVVYIGYKHVYRQNNKFPLTDLAITVITAFLWLISTFAWAKALADIKMSTGASIIPGIESCKAPGTTCRFASVTSMGTLNVSVVFGLLNMILWGGNVWFVYKDCLGLYEIFEVHEQCFCMKGHNWRCLNMTKSSLMLFSLFIGSSVWFFSCGLLNKYVWL